MYMFVCTCRYSLEHWEGVDRDHFNAVIDERDLRDTYLPAFQSCVQRSRASGVMCSYNAVNGVPSCASPGAPAVPRYPNSFAPLQCFAEGDRLACHGLKIFFVTETR